MKRFFVYLLLFAATYSHAQVTDTSSTDDEDYDQYGDVTYADGSGVKTYANARIVGGTPQRFVTVGWDFQGPYNMTFSRIGAYGEKDEVPAANQATGRAVSTGGLRISANIPVISRNNFTWQMGANFWNTAYRIEDIAGDSSASGVMREMNKNGLRTMGLNTTIYKPLNEYQFLLFQGSADMSGDFGTGLQNELRYSAAALWGERPNDRKQWAVGLSRTYRVGAMNWIPIFMYNWTSVDRKWGIESLLPARGAVRYNFSTTSMLLAGFELEGQSYRINALSDPTQSLEIRRGEIRPRIEYQRQLYGFFWLGAQLGYRLNFSFDADYLPNGNEFFRGFFGSQSFAMLNTIGNTPFVNLSISFVSP